MVFVSGQAGIDEQGRTVGAGDFDAQSHQAFRNLATVLEQAGSSLADVVKVTIMVTDMAYLDHVVRLRAGQATFSVTGPGSPVTGSTA